MPPRRNNAKAKQAAARATQTQAGKAQPQQAPVVEQKKLPVGAAVGIDFGTDTITLAAYKSDSFDIIVNANGERYTPVTVGYTSDEIVLGGPASAIAIRNPTNTIHRITAFLGRTYESLTEDDKKTVNCKVVAGEDGLACFSVEYKGGEHVVSPDDVITAFATSLKKYTEGYWDSPVKATVLSIPTRLSEECRQRYVAAVEKAGFDVLGTIAEPCAAVMSFHFDNPEADRKQAALAATPFAAQGGQTECILVVDVGAEQTRTNVVIANQGLIHLEGQTATTLDCSGAAIDKVVFDYFAKEFARENDGLDLKQSQRAVGRLEHAIDQVKRTLSVSTRAGVQLDGLYQGYDLFSEISRAKFDVFCDPVFNAFSTHLENTFTQFNGRITPDQITSVVLAGGTTSLARFTALIDAFFRKYHVSPKIHRHVNICDSIAFGAAKQAALLSIHQNKNHEKDLAAIQGQYDSIATTSGVAAPESAAMNTRYNKTKIPTYHLTPVTIGKNIYIKTFYNTFILAVPTTASASSVHHSTFTFAKPIPDNVTPYLGLYESNVSTPQHVTENNAGHIGTFTLDRNAIQSALAPTPEHITPVTVVVRFTIDKNFTLTVEVAYHSKSSPTLTWTPLREFPLVNEGTPLTVTSIASSIGNNGSDSLAYARLVAQIQMVGEKYVSWKATPKHHRFINRNAFMTPFITQADDAFDALQVFIQLPNPYSETITPFTADVLATLPPVNKAEQLFEAFGKAIADVLHYRKYTAAEAQTELNRMKKSSNSNPVVVDDESGDDLSLDLDLDLSVASSNDDMLNDFEIDLQMSDVASVTDELDIDIGLDDLDVSFGKLSIDGDDDEDNEDLDFNLGGDLD